MNCDFIITCTNCGSTEVIIKATAIEYGNKVRVQLQCESCKHTAEMHGVSVPFSEMVKFSPEVD